MQTVEERRAELCQAVDAFASILLVEERPPADAPQAVLDAYAEWIAQVEKQATSRKYRINRTLLEDLRRFEVREDWPDTRALRRAWRASNE